MDKKLRERLNRSTRPVVQDRRASTPANMHAVTGTAAPRDRNSHNHGQPPAPAVQNAKNMRRKRRKRGAFKTLLRAVGLLLLLVLVAGAAFYVSLQSRMTISPAPTALTTPTPLPTEPFNLAIFGSDARDPNEQARADTIMLAHIDPVNNQMWMVSIPRDTRVELPGRGTSKINAAYAIGGSDMAIQAVKNATGQDVHYFITLNFWGFEGIVDAMGGIEIDVPFAIDDPRGDITPDRSASQIEAGLQTLDGAHALTFVRHRDGFPDGDFGRMRAQQDFFRAMGSQLTDTPVWRLPLVANSFADNTTTNLRPFELAMVARAMHGVDSDNMHLATLPGQWRAPYVVTDETAAAQIWRNFGTAPFDE